MPSTPSALRSAFLSAAAALKEHDDRRLRVIVAALLRDAECPVSVDYAERCRQTWMAYFEGAMELGDPALRRVLEAAWDALEAGEQSEVA